MSQDLLITPRRRRVIEYPDSDGAPMAETDPHVLQILYLLAALRWWFRTEQKVYVGANNFLYYGQGNPKKRISPDVYVAWGVTKRRRRSYKLWEEGQPPGVVFEITSSETKEEDLGRKRVIYAEIGVTEYYLFDPFAEYLNPPLRAYQLVGKEYQPREIEALPLFPDQPTDGFHGWRLFSDKLKLEIRALPTQEPDMPYILRFFNPNTGELVVDLEQAIEEREKLTSIVAAAETRVEAEIKARTEAEARAKALEEENARLRAELEKLRGKIATNSSGH